MSTSPSEGEGGSDDWKNNGGGGMDPPNEVLLTHLNVGRESEVDTLTTRCQSVQEDRVVERTVPGCLKLIVHSVEEREM